MSTQIQFLRTDQPQLRPDPNVLANGMPLLNFNEQEPGLFFKARDGSLFKVGPTAVGETAPNTAANGFTGNTLGEMWLDTSGLVSELKVYDGVDWVIPGAGSTQVSSVGLSMPVSIFDVENSPITTAGTFEVNLQPQVRNRFLGGPLEGAAQIPTFRALGGDDIPSLDASKIGGGIFNQARIPSLDASKITSGVFNSARIPGIDATKIISGVLPYTFGGTGIGTTPLPGELLIGGVSTGWNKTTLTSGAGIQILNGAGSIQIRVSPPGSNGSVLFNNNGILGADSDFSYSGVSKVLDLNGTLTVAGGITMETTASPSPIAFKPLTGSDVSIAAPSLVTSGYALKLPQSIPSANTDRVMTSDGAGQLSLTDSPSVENISVRTGLSVESSSNGTEVLIRAASATTSSYNLTLPPAPGTGGAVTSDSSGNLSISQTVSITDLTATSSSLSTQTLRATNPPRHLISGYASLSVSSNGTYDLLDLPFGGSAGFVHLTVFVHDETAGVGTGTLTVSYNAHYDGSTAVLSSPIGAVDSFTGTEPTFAVAVSSGDLMFRTTTASGSNELRFHVMYSYGVNVQP